MHQTQTQNLIIKVSFSFHFIKLDLTFQIKKKSLFKMFMKESIYGKKKLKIKSGINMRFKRIKKFNLVWIIFLGPVVHSNIEFLWWAGTLVPSGWLEKQLG